MFFKCERQDKVGWDSWFDDEDTTSDFMADRDQPNEQTRDES
ncbi:hypothetical protein [Xenorhabdus innexi]|uniref:Antitoxin n=1 Tax=Xenorhabdus innexi TaxID=290109 RepID=A0A1N6MST7_9GAMM|nr:hypothetical protein [Xenorhabdus innexi]PHM30153.1 antitoxin [Xenorhabdus innexi]SIP71918.1 hypothetical protein XIS1_1290015 [Xenorhabdus innexi]